MASSQGMQLQLQPIILMLVQVQVVVVVILSLSAATIAAPPTEADLKNLDCMNRCGNLSIPYPFGVKENCYRSEDFFINCSDSQPYLRHSDITISNISLEEGELRIMNYISRNCYDRLGTPLQSNFDGWLVASNLSISSTKNKFTSIGCDTYGFLHILENESLVFTTGCVSSCMSISYVPDDGSCSGIGCCQTSIPKRLSHIEIDVHSFNNHTDVLDFNPCSYAFVVEEAAFNFSTTYLQDFKETKVPLVLDWGIGDNKTCDEAKRNLTSYACGDNSDCYEAEIGNGYICKCSKGYEGNAYLSDGCRDIDECADPNLNHCVEESKCLNTHGNYTCSCPKRYHGDGKTDGTRCTAAGPDLVLLILIDLISGIGVLLLIIASWWLYKVQEKRNNKKRKEKFFKRNGGLLLKEKLSSSSCDGSVEKTKLFSSKELEKAIDHYNKDRILGQGGQGTVYKGMLSDGSIVSIKKSKIVDEGNVGQFINEVVMLSQINHRNVVKLLGCCLETEVPLVVYELISNGTLFEHIHGANEDFPLPWKMRLRIATEIAGALSYLHFAAFVPIYHRDIKSTNILLDDKYRAKVSFGSSRSVAIDQTHFTTQVQGTFGYLDPEYFQSSQFTEKSDVYSFGVVIVELLIGQKAISSVRSQESRSLATFFIQSMEDNHLFEILDQKIIKEDWREEIIAVAHLAKRCLNLNGKKRPTMKDVAVELEGIRMLRGNTTTQQNYEVFDYNRTDLNEAWDATSTSTRACFDITSGSSFDIKPLLLNEP